MSDKRDKVINLRVSETEKSDITKRAESVGIDASSFIRNAALTDDKIVLLSEGTEIAKSLCTLVCDIRESLKKGKIDSTYAPVILGRIEALVSSFNTLTDRLSDLSGEKEEQE